MSTRGPSRPFACWWPDSRDEVTPVTACSHRDAAISFVHRKLGEFTSHENAPDSAEVGVVDLETGETSFVYVRVTMDVTDEQPRTGPACGPSESPHPWHLDDRGRSTRSCAGMSGDQIPAVVLDELMTYSAVPQARRHRDIWTLKEWPVSELFGADYARRRRFTWAASDGGCDMSASLIVDPVSQTMTIESVSI